LNLSPYSAYEASGVEWLGNVPSHWGVKRLRYVCRFAYGDSLAAEDREDGPIMVFGSNGAVGTHIASNTQKPVIVVGRKGSHGKTNFSEQEVFAIDTTYFIDYQHTRADLRWLFYALGTLGLDAVSKDSAVPGLAREDAYAHCVATPPADEQRAIADFLDREMAKLDTLVEKKRALIEKLKEKRAALISRTVTRGLPPDAARAAGLNPHPKLKPSRVEWIGEVPEHWIVCKLSHVTISRCDGPFGSGLKSEHYCDEGVRVIRLQNIRFASFDDTDKSFIDPDHYLELGDHDVHAGDVLIAGLGDDKHPVGRACVAPATLGPAMVKADCFRFRLDARKADAAFAALQLSIVASNLSGALATGTTRGRMNLSATAERVVALPSLKEQCAIANYLNHETTKIDRLIEKVEAASERLREYRTALITAAVTGKIDVRALSPDPSPAFVGEGRNKVVAA